jgi:hypothetical protein
MNDLVVTALAGLPAEYQTMLEGIAASMPAVGRASENFHKSASQFKTATLDNTHLTPFRTIKQTLAEIDRTRQALEEAHIKRSKNNIEIRRREAKTPADTFDQELARVEITELRWINTNIENSMRGAIRKLAFQIAQYRAVLAHLKKDTFTEADYEREEVRYHILTALKQGWIAANARGGYIDEGNLIYCFDLGLPLMVVRAAIKARYDVEEKMLQENKQFEHVDTLAWLSALAAAFEKYPGIAAKARGLSLRVDALLLGAKPDVI